MIVGIIFTNLDLSNAYLQMPLANESKLCTMINTHLGLFQYNRFCFEMTSTQSMFQRVMENLLKVMTHVGGYLDDIMITGETRKEHDVNLEMVIRRSKDPD